MSKLKNPLLSLKAHGSIGNSVTFVERGGHKIAEKKPTLPYFLTLPVQYQRWLYQDYAYLWTQQSTATQKIYKTRAARNHTTPISEWLRYYLTNLPDIAAWWRLDGNAKDSSKLLSHGTIYGALTTPGQIDKALWFDGVNDYVQGNFLTTLTNNFSVELFLRPESYPTPADSNIILELYTGTVYALALSIQDEPTTWIVLYAINTAGVYAGAIAVINVPLNQVSHIIATVNTTASNIYLNGQLLPNLWSLPIVGTLRSHTTYRIGRELLNRFPWHGWLDNLIIYNRTLDAAEALRHSQRRYP